MATADELARESYLSLTTFRRTGEPVATPVWVSLVSDGRIGFWTAQGTGKTKRINQDPAVVVQPCTARGRLRPGTEPTKGLAEMVRSGPLFEEVQAAVRAKYGLMTHVTRLLAGLGPLRRRGLTYADTVVLVRLDDGRP